MPTADAYGRHGRGGVGTPSSTLSTHIVNVGASAIGKTRKCIRTEGSEAASGPVGPSDWGAPGRLLLSGLGQNCIRGPLETIGIHRSGTTSKCRSSLVRISFHHPSALGATRGLHHRLPGPVVVWLCTVSCGRERNETDDRYLAYIRGGSVAALGDGVTIKGPTHWLTPFAFAWTPKQWTPPAQCRPGRSLVWCGVSGGVSASAADSTPPCTEYSPAASQRFRERCRGP